jgi:lysyl-tRNA synthetase class 2
LVVYSFVVTHLTSSPPAFSFPTSHPASTELIQVTEEMVAGMVLAINGSYLLQYHPDGPGTEPIEVDFTPPFERVSMLDELAKVMGEKVRGGGRRK